MEKTKICKKCNVEFPATNEYFDRNNKNKDGLWNHCKECRHETYKSKYVSKKEQKRISECVPEGMKKCCDCGNIYPATKEHFGNRGKGKLKSYCRECVRKQNRENYKINDRKKEYVNNYRIEWYANNKDYIKDYNKKYREENKEKLLADKKIYHIKNREEILKKHKEYYYDNRELMIEKSRQYQKNNREKLRITAYKYRQEHKDLINKMSQVSYQKRKAYKINIDATLTIEQWDKIKKDFNYSCAYCGRTEEENYNIYNGSLNQDHFIALSKGGEYTHNNIVPACKGCNCSKQDKDFAEWYPEQPSYSKKREKFILNYLHYTNDGEQQLSIAL